MNVTKTKYTKSTSMQIEGPNNYFS